MPEGLARPDTLVPARLCYGNISHGNGLHWIASADVGEPYCIGFSYAITFQIKVDAKVHWKPK
jgi:hypothetical protein